MKAGTNYAGPILVLIAAVCWGCMGFFVRRLSALGFDPVQITSARLSVAALVFWALALLRGPGEAKIRLRDLPLFLALGLVSVLFFTVCYFSAISMLSLSTAAILLYTSPIWVMLLSILFLGERFSRRKLLALALAFGGCVLVSGLGGGALSLRGLLLGLGSGIGYGLYSIFGTIALRRYSSYTVTAYTFLIAALGSFLIRSPAGTLAVLAASPAPLSTLGFLIVTGLFTAVLPFLCYTLGLQRMEASRAAILATVEPLVATLLGVFLFSETLSLSSALGILLILAAVVLLNRRSPAAS